MSLLNTEHILFHAFKHYLPAITTLIRESKRNPLAASIPLIRTIGASQFDLYTGSLSSAVIKKEVIAYLATISVVSEAAYREWIEQHNGYRTLVLTDHSEWTLRFVAKETFIHLHPSRYAAHTIRIKANAMKSIIAYLLTEKYDPVKPDITKLNHIRAQYLSLPPLEPGSNHDELYKVYHLVGTAINH